MSLLDRFLDAIKLNDDDYDEEDFLDDDLDDDTDEVNKPKSRFFNRFDDDDDLEDEDVPVKKAASSKSRPAAKSEPAARPSRREKEKPAAAKRSKVTPIRRKTTAAGSMEVNVIRPVSMEDTRDIADTLLDYCTVILNLEGLDVDTAQRIIDFTCGACYSVGGSLQKVSSYIFIVTPRDVDISGDFEDILSGSFDLASIKSSY